MKIRKVTKKRTTCVAAPAVELFALDADEAPLAVVAVVELTWVVAPHVHTDTAMTVSNVSVMSLKALRRHINDVAGGTAVEANAGAPPADTGVALVKSSCNKKAMDPNVTWVTARGDT